MDGIGPESDVPLDLLILAIQPRQPATDISEGRVTRRPGSHHQKLPICGVIVDYPNLWWGRMPLMDDTVILSHDLFNRKSETVILVAIQATRGKPDSR